MDMSIRTPGYQSVSITTLIIKLEYLAVYDFHNEETLSYAAYRLWNAAAITNTGASGILAPIDTGIFAEEVAKGCSSLRYAAPEASPKTIRLYIERAVAARKR